MTVATLALLAAVGTSGACAASTDTSARCDCVRATLEERIELADFVVVGRTLAFTELESAEFEVVETFKSSDAVAGDSLRVSIAPSDCDYFLPPIVPEAGDAYLLFGTVSEGTITVTRCLGSGPVPERSESLEALRNRRSP